MSFSQSYTTSLEELIKAELLPTYLRYYRLMNMPAPLSDEHRGLLRELLPPIKKCLLVQAKNSTLDPKP